MRVHLTSGIVPGVRRTIRLHLHSRVRLFVVEKRAAVRRVGLAEPPMERPLSRSFHWLLHGLGNEGTACRPRALVPSQRLAVTVRPKKARRRIGLVDCPCRPRHTFVSPTVCFGEASLQRGQGGWTARQILWQTDSTDGIILVARLLLAALFLIFGWRKLVDYSGTVSRMCRTVLPIPALSAVDSDLHGASGCVRGRCWSVHTSFSRTFGFIHAWNSAHRASAIGQCQMRIRSTAWKDFTRTSASWEVFCCFTSQSQVREGDPIDAILGL